MKLTDKQIEQLMENPRNGDAIVTGSTLEKEHKLHITGEGYKESVSKVDGWEGANDFNIKKQVAQPATIQLTSIILDNLNRWTSVQGTVKKVDFKDKQVNEAFQDVLDQVWRGDSFEKFLNSFYKEAIYTDFNGFVIVTKPKVIDAVTIEKDGVIQPKPEGNLDPYMIFVSNTDVHDFYLTGDKVEYLIVRLGDDRYRLMDDEKDIVLTWKKGATNNIIPQRGSIEYLPNEIGYVPARKISALSKSILNSQVKTSPIDHIMPALNRYFSTDADLRMQFIRHNYPKLAIVTKECAVCGGSGRSAELRNDGSYDINTLVPCTACDGTGKIIPISREGVIGLPAYLNNGDTAYPGAPASYITPDTESLRLGLEDLEKQRQEIIYSGTGDKNLVAESLNTATENVINSRSLEDRIREITTMIEGFEVFIKQSIKDLHKDFAAKSDYYITVRYGKRIGTKGEDELLNEMKASKEAGMPGSYISALHKDLIYAKYKNNAPELERQLLLADIEPLSGYTIADLDKVKDYVYSRDLELKLNFDSIISEIEQTTPLLYFMPESNYPDRVTAINTMIDEILQKRVGARGGDNGPDVAAPAEDPA
jgi:hypothetical protein